MVQKVGSNGNLKRHLFKYTEPMETDKRINDSDTTVEYYESAVLQHFEPTGDAESRWQVALRARFTVIELTDMRTSAITIN